MSKRKKICASVLRTVLLALVAMIVGINLYLWNATRVVGNALPMPFGYGMAVVMSGSMEPELYVDDLIIVHNTDDYTVGDVVVYQTGRTPIVHKIIAIEGDTVITQGTANNTADAPISMQDIKGEVVCKLSGVGKLVDALRSPVGVFVVLGIAFLLLELSYRKDRKDDLEEQERIKAEIRRLKGETDEDPQA